MLRRIVVAVFAVKVVFAVERNVDVALEVVALQSLAQSGIVCGEARIRYVEWIKRRYGVELGIDDQ